MRLFFRIIGWLIVAFGLILMARDAVVSRAEGVFAFAPLGKLWYDLHAGSLNLLQAVVERYISEKLWFSLFQPVLEAPAFLVFLLLGTAVLIVTMILGSKKDDRRRRKR